MTNRRNLALGAAAFLLMTGAGITVAPAAFAGTTGGTDASDRNSDFDGDGYNDVLTGAPGGTVGGKKGAGYVTVQYGSAGGIGTADTRPRVRTAVFSQSTAGVSGTAEAGDAFGAAVATGDVNSDGYDDAIIGSPGEDLAGVVDAGRANVLYGSASGLRGVGSVSLEAVTPKREVGYGGAVAAARFTAATPGDMIAVSDDEGVDLFSDEGPLLRVTRLETVDDPGDRSVVPAGLTTGNFDGDGYADLVVSGYSLVDDEGVRGRSVVFKGGEHALAYVRDLTGGPSAAAGDVNGDGYDELVTGDESSSESGGLVAIRYGGEDGLTDLADELTQDSPGVPGAAEEGDGWGADLSVADTDGDGYADIAIGAPGEDIGTVADAGAVWVIRGQQRGWTPAGVRSFDQNSTYVPGSAEAADAFGAQVRLVDTDRGGRCELLAAAPGENTGDGVVIAFPAATTGITADGSWLYGGGSFATSGTDALFGAAIDE
ncbi:integrin alpha [Streptomyces sp. NBC_01275]|uniref:FG-GAP repeat protein n=1 Tax=Streptomyces sp. NBC_01275 TaxID=2903807 RepID=UPI00225AEB43|nr:FG-GAP repeat protein [Streptomyces sp. NBC_01275]MCX4767668.1 integrin alpha [Streptomyces sp. NBC_01275]